MADLYFPVLPESLSTSTAYLKLLAYDYDWRLYGSSLAFLFNEQAEQKAEKNMISDPKAHIYLPIPNGGFGVQDNMVYDETKGGVTVANRVRSILIDSIQKAGVVGRLATAYGDVATTQAGVALNQFLVHTFKGIALRQYTYTWNFIPYSKEDAKALMDIIKTFRKYSLPEYEADNWTIKYPSFWKVAPYVNGNMFFEMNYLVISNIKVDFGSESQVTFFHDGTPTQTTLSITFKEVYPQGSEIFKEGGRYSGTGRI